MVGGLGRLGRFSGCDGVLGRLMGVTSLGSDAALVTQ